jgi:hypothetical protein
MTIDTVDWILRFPSDELRMRPEMLNRINATIAASKGLPPKIIMEHGIDDETGRRVVRSQRIADRELTIVTTLPTDRIEICVKGETQVAVSIVD